MRKYLGMDSKVVTGELLGNMYPCRIVDKAVVKSAFPFKTKKVAAFPASDNEALVEVFGKVYQCSAAKNVFETALNSPNISIHLACSLINAGAIDQNPEAGIDLWSFQNLIQVFERMRQNTNGSILIISHQERILNIADEIVVIADGRVVNQGTRDEIMPQIMGTASAVDACSKFYETA